MMGCFLSIFFPLFWGGNQGMCYDSKTAQPGFTFVHFFSFFSLLQTLGLPFLLLKTEASKSAAFQILKNK